MIKQIPPWFGARNLALAMAVLSLSYVFGGAAAVSLAGQVSEWSGQSWRVVMGAPSLILLLLLGACVAFLPRDHGADRHAEDPDEPRSGFSWALLGELLRLRVFWILCALSFTLTLLRETFNDWAVDFIKTSGGAQLSVRVAAFLSTPFDICGAAGIIFIGVMMGRLTGRARSWLLAGSLLSLFVILVLLPVLVPLGLYAIVPAVGAVGFLSLGPYSLMAGYFAVQLRGPQCAGTISGIVDSVGYFAGVLAGSAFGWLLDHGGYTLGFHVLAGLSLASALLLVPRTCLISEILDSRTKIVASIASVDDFVASNELISKILAMVSEEREVNAIFQELFSASGNDIFLHDSSLYLPNNNLNNNSNSKDKKFGSGSKNGGAASSSSSVVVVDGEVEVSFAEIQYIAKTTHDHLVFGYRVSTCLLLLSLLLLTLLLLLN